MRRSRAALFATATSIVILAGCSKNNPPNLPGATPTSTTTASATGSPRFVSLTGPPTPVLCAAPSSVELHWETRGAAKVELRINGGQVFATYPGGKSDRLVPLTCDGRTQAYELTAHAPSGASTSKTLTLTERVPAT